VSGAQTSTEETEGTASQGYDPVDETLSKYLQERLSLRNTFLFSVQCLKISMRRNPDSIQMMKQLAASVPRVVCEMNFLDSVSTKWRLYQADADILPEWVETPNNHVASIDDYWTGHGYPHRRMV